MLTLLKTGLEKLGLEPTTELCEDYLTYIELLIKWNKTYNLTAIKEPEEMVNLHIFDSLSVHSYIQGENCLDVGTGAGLPGLILALAQPERKWTLLDSNQKKLRFIQHVKTSLNINNINIVHDRVEDFQIDELFNSIICRAYSSLNNFYHSCYHLLQSEGVLLAMKGKLDEDEISEIKTKIKSITVKNIDVPEKDVTRCLVVMSV